MSLARPSLLALGLTIGLLPSATMAQQAGAANFREKFIQLDANGDTSLERDEIPETGRAAFDRLLDRGDSNANGKLDADELRTLAQKVQAVGGPAAGAMAGARLKAMDKDGDGKVSRSEFTGPAPRFTQMDTDKDGQITMKEARLAMPAAQPAAPSNTNAEAAGPMAARIKAMDKDGDGKISKDEFPRPNAFDRLDVNNDGFLTPDEMPRAAGAARPKAKAKEGKP